MKEQLVFSIPENEYWWGGAVNCGFTMPVTARSACRIDQHGDNAGDQYAPLFVSSAGRYLWSERAFVLTAERGRALCEGDAEVVLREGFGDLRGAYLAAMRAHFPFLPALPDKRFFTRPQYNTWIELGTEQTQEAVLRYARGITEHDMPSGILMIDEGWQEDYGVFEFNRRKMPRPREMIDALHDMGFSVMLWVTPNVACAGPRYQALAARGFLVKDKAGDTAVRRWWNGYSSVLDLSNPGARAWLHEQLQLLMSRYGVDGFKFDGGDRYFYRDDDRTFGSVSAREQTRLFNEIGEEYALNEYRAAWRCGGRPIVARLQDKFHSWDHFGINTLVPNTVVQGILGYAYGCPDMVGGGNIGSFTNGQTLDEELFVRWAQASALMGMMQMSVSPWRVLSPANAALVERAMRLHSDMGDAVYALARNAARTGEPIVRHMAYVFPGEDLETTAQQFMLGDSILVAPVLTRGETSHTVRLPKGQWRGWNALTYRGGRDVSVAVTLSDLPWFERIE